MKYILYLLFILYPFAYTNYAKPRIGVIELGIDDLLLMLALPLGFLAIVNQKSTARSSSRFKIPPLATTAIIASAIYALNVLLVDALHRNSLSSSFQTLGGVIAFLLAAYALRSASSFRLSISLLKISALVLALSAILSAYGILNSGFFNVNYSYRAFLGAKYASTGMVQSRGGYGINMAFILPFVAYGLMNSGSLPLTCKSKRSLIGRMPVQAIHLPLLFTLFFSVVITGSRSTWMMTAVVILFYMMFSFSEKAGPLAISAFAFAWIAVILLLMNQITAALNEVYNISTAGVDSRIRLNFVAVKAFFQNPLYGLSQQQLFRLADGQISIHNYFLNVAAQYGLMGLGPLFLLFISIGRMLFWIRRKFKAPQKEMAACLISGLMGMLVELMFYPGGEKQLWIYLGISISIYTYIWNVNRRRAMAVG